MKKAYQRPQLICEDLHPEELLCACKVKNPSLNEEWHCGFEPDGLGFTIFATNWDKCNMKEGDGPMVYCYHVGVVNVFGS